MKSQVMFYGNIQKAQMVLACVQAVIVDCHSPRRTPATGAILQRYAAELEEIEADLVALINASRTPADTGGAGQGDWVRPPSNGDVQDV